MTFFNRRATSGAALALLAIVFIALVAVSGLLLRGVRLDLTESRLYTLSDGTERIVGNLAEPVNLYFFFSEHAAKDYPAVRTYAQRVRELLEEVAARSDGKIRLEVIDPQPFSEAEDRATAYGLQGIPVGTGGETLFFGLAGTNSTDGQVVAPFFQPDKEAFLEYDVAKLISNLATDKKPVLGVLSSLPMGPALDPASGRPTLGWTIDSQLRELFELRRLQPGLTSIGDDVDLLMLVHPKNLSDDALYAIDQFVLRGGRLLVFVDPDAETDPVGADPMGLPVGDRSSDLPKLFKAWGLSYDSDRVVLDAQLALQVQPDPGQPPVRHLAFLGLGSESLNQNDVVSADLEAINLASAGHLGLVDESATIKLEPLAQSSGTASTIDTDQLRLQADPRALEQGFRPGGERFVLAARLTGELETAFPERAGEGHLAASKAPANLIVVADTDLLTDRLWVQAQDFFGQRILNAFANNGDFVFNAVDNLVGNADLIAVRTRATSSRPFTVVQRLQRRADERFRATERELQEQLVELERKLGELQSRQGADGQNELLLTPAQQKELQNFQGERVRIRSELRQVRRQLDADIQALGARLKFINIVGVPLLVIVAALLFAYLRARRRRFAEAEGGRA